MVSCKLSLFFDCFKLFAFLSISALDGVSDLGEVCRHLPTEFVECGGLGLTYSKVHLTDSELLVGSIAGCAWSHRERGGLFPNNLSKMDVDVGEFSSLSLR